MFGGFASKLVMLARKTALTGRTKSLWSWGKGNSSTFGGAGQGIMGTGDIGSRDSIAQIGTDVNWLLLPYGCSSYSTANNMHMTAIKENGTLWAWGPNASGQLGQGNTTVRSSPVQVGTGNTWTLVSQGLACTFAIRNDGTLWSWGLNTNGRLGLRDVTVRSSPVQIGTDTNWAQVAGGNSFALAVKTNGTLWSWGVNTSGQLGQRDVLSRSSPVQIGSDTDWAKVFAGTASSFAIKSTGTLWAWGYNTYYGQLGLGDRTHRSSPVQIGTDTDWSLVRPGRNHTLAIKTTGTLWGWGRNTDGRLGTGNVTNRSSPVQIGSDTNWANADAGYGGSLAIRTTGSLWGWGANTYGELVAPSKSGNALSPLQIGTLTDWATGATAAKISVNGSSTHTIKHGRTLWAWGANTSGQLGFGIGDTITRSSPVQVGSATDWSMVTGNGYRAGSRSTMAVKTGGTLWGWGTNAKGQLGLGDITDRQSPVQVGAGTTWKYVAVDQHALAVKTDGTLWSWGYNNFGQLGSGTTTSRSSPVQVGTDTDWSKVAVGDRCSFAIKTTGTLWSWGYNLTGRLGSGTTTSRSSPVQVGTDTDWSSIGIRGGTYGTHCFAVKTTGTLWSWGVNTYGQLGLGDTTVRSSPVQVGSDTNWSFAEIGSARQSVAIKTTGSLWMWGRNINGVLGVDDTRHRSSPVQVGTDTNWSAVSTGYRFTIAGRTTGTLWFWGNKAFQYAGLAGTSSMVYSRSSPVQIGALTTWQKVSLRGSATVFGIKD